MDCFLVLRGIKTLAVRMQRHSQNALSVAKFLEERPEVVKVMYPFLDSSPYAVTAREQMVCGGGMVSLVLKGGQTAAHRMAGRTRLFTLAESLGGVESLIEVPAAMTHQSTAGSPLAVDPGLVRLSVGLESVDDLLEDLEQALR
jgi:cystathionine beta-lyase/cystathionine gamma-synthase